MRGRKSLALKIERTGEVRELEDSGRRHSILKKPDANYMDSTSRVDGHPLGNCWGDASLCPPQLPGTAQAGRVRPSSRARAQQGGDAGGFHVLASEAFLWSLEGSPGSPVV